MVEFSQESADTKHQRNWEGGNTFVSSYGVSFPAKLLPVYKRCEFVHVISQVLCMEICDGLQTVSTSHGLCNGKNITRS